MLNLSNCSLRSPSIDLMPSLIEAIDEGFQIRAAGPDFTPEEIEKIKTQPQEWLDNLVINRPKTITLPTGKTIDRVPQTIFWFCERMEFIGIISIRHRLNEWLENFGGHIGYVVRPKYRGQGVATEMLKRARIYCREELKLEKVLLDCDEVNIASARVIEKNDGELINIVPHPYEEGRLNKRYWVPTVSA